MVVFVAVGRPIGRTVLAEEAVGRCHVLVDVVIDVDSWLESHVVALVSSSRSLRAHPVAQRAIAVFRPSSKSASARLC